MEKNIENVNTNETVNKKKRGRKPTKPKKNNYYFDKNEEEAVIDYNKYGKLITMANREILKMVFECTDKDLDKMLENTTIYELLQIAEDTPIENKNVLYQISELKYDINIAKTEQEKIYKKFLYPAFCKMIESIMRRYNLFVPNEDSGDTFNDTMSFLTTKMDKYDEEKECKAYSYYGNICKNYIIGKKQKYEKSLVRNPSYDSSENECDIMNISKYTNSVDRGDKIAKEIVDKLIKQFTVMYKDPYKYDLKESEVKLGKALANLMENWDYVISADGSNKLNKNAILLFLREQTGLDTKGIRDNMKKFKNEFLIIKKIVIE